MGDDWLSKDKLLDGRVAEDKKRELLQANKPPPKVRSEREKTRFPSVTTVVETESVSESVSNAPPLESVKSKSESESKSTEGPTTSLRLNPRKRTQRKVMNVGHSNVKSHFAPVDRTRELQLERNWTRGVPWWLGSLLPWIQKKDALTHPFVFLVFEPTKPPRKE